jgi:hypothetical protein
MSQTNSLFTLDTAGNAVPATAEEIRLFRFECG